MKILVSDYSGHPFQVQLSRTLASRGHDVLHVFSESFSTPKGNIYRADDDSPLFNSIGVSTKAPFEKNSFVKRRFQEIEIGRAIAMHIRQFRPDIVLSSNAPLDTLVKIHEATRKISSKFIFWIQDIYSDAMRTILPRKFGLLGSLVAQHYRRIEKRIIDDSDHAVVIAPEFAEAIQSMANLPRERVTIIENWAPLDELPSGDRDNEWAAANLRTTAFRAVYSGTLGYKHNPRILLKLAKCIEGDVLVFSEGPAVDALVELAKAEGVSNLLVQGWLPFADLPHALAAADVLIVLLEPQAGAFSVPSKVLTYLCVGRPILGAISSTNLASRIIRNSGAGIVVEPGNEEGFILAAMRLAADRKERLMMSRAARNHAERTFDIAAIADKFEHIFTTIKS